MSRLQALPALSMQELCGLPDHAWAEEGPPQHKKWGSQLPKEALALPEQLHVRCWAAIPMRAPLADDLSAEQTCMLWVECLCFSDVCAHEDCECYTLQSWLNFRLTALLKRQPWTMPASTVGCVIQMINQLGGGLKVLISFRVGQSYGEFQCRLVFSYSLKALLF